MAAVALLIGIYSYLVFSLGILGFLYKNTIIFLTLVYLGGVLWYFRGGLGKVRPASLSGELGFLGEIKKDRISFLLFLILFVQVLVNLAGALGPELGFDALWYHLTLPKIYLQYHRILYIPGNLLYYSSMPKLIEMLYVSSLALQGEILAKIIHFLFGILSGLAIFNLSRRYLSFRASLLATVSFYTSLVVGWQSITAYVDLARTFFEVLALDYFLRWWKSEKSQDLIESAIFLGLAISTKMLALGSLPIFLTLIFIKYQKNLRNLSVFSPPCSPRCEAGCEAGLQYSVFSILIPLPWLVFSFAHTHNPFYPLFSNILDSSHQIGSFNMIRFLTDFWNLFLRSADPIGPLFLIILPLIFIVRNKFKNSERMVLVYCLLAYIVWFFTPRTGGGRFFLPYLPAFCFMVAGVYEVVKKTAKGNILMVFVFLVSLVNLTYRGIANWRYLPAVFNKQSRGNFLINNLNFKFGDFYDYQGEIKNFLKPNDLVLTSGIHNLYYADFPYIDESWARPGLSVTHLLVRGNISPALLKKVNNRPPIYFNSQLNIRLYVLGGKL